MLGSLYTKSDCRCPKEPCLSTSPWRRHSIERVRRNALWGLLAHLKVLLKKNKVEELSFIQEIHTDLRRFWFWGGLFHQIRCVKYLKPPFESTNRAGVITEFMCAQTHFQQLKDIFFKPCFKNARATRAKKQPNLPETRVQSWANYPQKETERRWLGWKYPGLLVLPLGWLGPGLIWCWRCVCGCGGGDSRQVCLGVAHTFSGLTPSLPSCRRGHPAAHTTCL